MDLKGYLLRLLIGLSYILIISGNPLKSSGQKVLVKSYYIKSLNGKTTKVANPSIKRVRLYSSHHKTYVRLTNTTIEIRRGTTATDPNTIIILESYGPGRVTIRSNASKSYVCFNKTSHVVVQKTFDSGCVFNEIQSRDKYRIYESEYNNTWFLGFSKRKNHTYGQPKLGRKTSRNQKTIRFVRSPAS